MMLSQIFIHFKEFSQPEIFSVNISPTLTHTNLGDKYGKWKKLYKTIGRKSDLYPWQPWDTIGNGKQIRHLWNSTDGRNRQRIPHHSARTAWKRKKAHSQAHKTLKKEFSIIKKWQLTRCHFCHFIFPTRFSKKFKKFLKKCLTQPIYFAIMSLAFERTTDMREWRNRQTRTFEGRVVIPYGFKSRLSHQDLVSTRSFFYF